ncbi:glucose-6-phosphate isomerase|uniref:Glucose-6-phosphate isomerase n=1 Tax=Dendrosporobacter quercicolus TaxID=146817 RepID=A0A1G9WR41_9FIRM|nr:glucose-6-phosphate isomerase [Dendrosporobacter quercicolus]NSL49190.1 glucose-6-phosphate isomerase [Dendrosporobacter quercicolus DSM 1736]SDM87084.1 glucose-6-phosphate isomerase [Dendrosporobacter quercicolus]
MDKNKAKVVLDSGITFDYTNLYGDTKVTDADLADVAAKLARSHQAVAEMRLNGEVRGHVSKDGSPEKVLFTELPYVKTGNLNSPESINRLKQFGQTVRNQVDAVISFGIGGSYLGNKVLFDVHCGEFWNSKSTEARRGYPKLYFSGNNIDPRRTTEIIEQLQADAACSLYDLTTRPYRVMLIVISKSGATLDTMAAFMVIYEALQQLPQISVEVVAVTGPAAGGAPSLLGRLAAEYDWPAFQVPDGVGGRFSVFSEVGLITAACIGFDIDQFLAGARSMDEACQSGELWRNPALLNAALKYISAVKYGRSCEVFMPYADYLKSVAEWYVQLLAESLGKRFDKDGGLKFYGRTPVVAVGTTDMHAQTQLHQDGPRDKVIQFVAIGEWNNDPVIPDAFPKAAGLSALAGIGMSAALEVARSANAEALARDCRFNATIVLPRLSAFYLGQLLYMLALSVAYEGELANVDAFDQPGVEAYKRLMGPSLKQLKLTSKR